MQVSRCRALEVYKFVRFSARAGHTNCIEGVSRRGDFTRRENRYPRHNTTCCVDIGKRGKERRRPAIDSDGINVSSWFLVRLFPAVRIAAVKACRRHCDTASLRKPSFVYARG